MCLIGSAEGISLNRASQWQAQDLAKSLVAFLSLLIVRWLMGEIRAVAFCAVTLASLWIGSSAVRLVIIRQIRNT